MIPNWLLCRHEVSQGGKLAYARLAQYAGKDGECFPKQETLAAELGVSGRTANDYIRELVQHKLIEKVRIGLCKANRYFFLDHPWIHEGQPGEFIRADQDRQKTSDLNQKKSSGQERQHTSGPYNKENQYEGESMKEEKTHGTGQNAEGVPNSLEEAIAVARSLRIDEGFASEEFHAKKSVDWKDGYGNSIRSWRHHLQARWLTEQRKRNERNTATKLPHKRSSQPPRRFSAGNYNQPV